jgi:hypothetical protein
VSHGENIYTTATATGWLTGFNLGSFWEPGSQDTKAHHMLLMRISALVVWWRESIRISMRTLLLYSAKRKGLGGDWDYGCPDPTNTLSTVLSINTPAWMYYIIINYCCSQSTAFYPPPSPGTGCVVSMCKHLSLLLLTHFLMLVKA